MNFKNILPAGLAGLSLLAGSAFAGTVGLGSAGPANFSVLQIGSGNINIGGAGIIYDSGSQVGVMNKLALSGGSSLAGTAVLGSGATYTSTGGSNLGHVSQNAALLTQARNDALAASAAAAALASSGGGLGLTSITSPMSLAPGVYNLSTLKLVTGQFLTLAGGGSYVFNISGALALNGSAGIILGANLSAANVLFNITGTKDVTLTGRGEVSFLSGIILAPNAKVSLSSAAVFGEVIGGKDITLSSGTRVVPVPGIPVGPAPVPESGATATLTLLGCAALLAAKRFRPELLRVPVSTR